MIEYLETKKLFFGKFKYKIMLQSGCMLDYIKTLKQSKDDYILRGDITIYTNNYILIYNLYNERIIRVWRPKVKLRHDDIVIKNSEYDYRVTFNDYEYKILEYVQILLKNKNKNKNYKLPLKYANYITGIDFAKCKDYIFPPKYIYVKGEKNLTMLKLQIGECIKKIENIIQ